MRASTPSAPNDAAETTTRTTPVTRPAGLKALTHQLIARRAVGADGNIAPYGDALHRPPHPRRDVGRHDVSGATVVPERHAARLPAEAAREHRVAEMFIQHLEEVAALLPGELDDVAGEVGVDEQALLARLRMDPHHGVHGL